MEYSKRLQADLKKQLKTEQRMEARADREIAAQCAEYRSWFQLQREQKKDMISILAEGDSWFRYIVGKAVIFQLEKLLKIEILNLAFPGDETRDFLSPKQKARLISELKKGPAKRMKFDYLLFSGGGNDLVGTDRFYKWLHPYTKGMTAADVLNKKTLKAALMLVEMNYEELIELRDENSPKTQIILHAYDFAIPDGRGVCGKGPWMEPSLEMRKVPKSLRQEVVKLFLIEFDKLLKKVARRHKLVKVVTTQGTLANSEWANELHPTSPGFKRIAKLFAKEIL